MAQRPKIQLKKAFLRHAGKVIKAKDLPEVRREHATKRYGHVSGLGKPVYAPPDKHAPAPKSADDLIVEAQDEIAAEQAEEAATVVVEPEKTPEKGGFKLNPGQMKAILIVTGPARHTLVFGGARCVAGNTVLDGQDKTIAELAAVGEPVLVRTSHGEQWAEAPFQKGVAGLLLLEMASGRRVEVTPDHRFWDGQRWKAAKDFEIGDRVAVLGGRSSETFLQWSSSGRSPSEFGANAQSYRQKSLGSKDRCFLRSHRHDGQPLEAIGGVRVCGASSRGEEQRNLAYLQAGRDEPDIHTDLISRRVSEHSLACLWLSHFASKGDFQPIDRRRRSEALDFEHVSGSFQGTPQDDRQSDERSNQLRSLFGLDRNCVFQFGQSHQPLAPRDTPDESGYALDNITSITSTSVQPFYTLHVPGCEHYFANGVLHHNSGKTFLFTRFIIVRALKCDNSRHAILRFRANAVKSSIVEDTFPTVMRECFPGIKYELKLQNGYFQLPNGSQVWFAGLDDKARVEKILGQEFATMYFNECSQIPYSSIMVARTRLAQKTDLKQRAFYDLNPTGTGHWSYLEFVSKLNPLNRNPIRNPDDFQYAVINPMDNVENLDQAFLDELEGYPEKLRKRFFEGKFVDEIDGALWTYELIEQCRVELREKRPEFTQIVVAVDPSGAAGKEDERSDDIGIIVVGLTAEKVAYVIADYTLRDSPQKWGQKAVWAYRHHKADRIICEKNFGGEMVRFVLQTADPTVPVKVITASLGKHIRAEPISALYEQGTVKHYGRFPELEDQLVNFSSSGYQGDRSPDRADAMIWALTDLMLGAKTPRAYVGRYSMRR